MITLYDVSIDILAVYLYVYSLKNVFHILESFNDNFKAKPNISPPVRKFTNYFGNCYHENYLFNYFIIFSFFGGGGGNLPHVHFFFECNRNSALIDNSLHEPSLNAAND